MKTRDDVITTLNRLVEDLRTDPESWENPTLDRFINAMAAWLDSGRIRQLESPSWELICDMLEAGKIYE